MSLFAKLEQACASFIERAFARTFPSDLEPAQIARKLVATMEARTRNEEGRLIAPGAYTIYVSPSDYERLADHQKYLERAWADLLRELAGRVGAAFETNGVRVAMAARTRVPLGAIEIELGDVTEASSFSLQTIEGVPPGARYQIAESARVGRAEESEIVLLDPGVSRAHAIIEVRAGAAVVRDLGSTNGTFVNGRRVETSPLENGDELRFGNTRMRFEIQ